MSFSINELPKHCIIENEKKRCENWSVADTIYILVDLLIIKKLLIPYHIRQYGKMTYSKCKQNLHKYIYWKISTRRVQVGLC